MALLNIVKEGDPVLRGVCREVTEITPRILTLLDDMRETLAKAEGVGLAAPQVGILKRAFVVDIGEGKIEIVNPVIVKAEGSQIGQEGCLSVPDVWGDVERPNEVTLEGFDRSGNKITVSGTELLARAFCHEYDHLNGELFTDKIIEEE